VPQKHPNIVIQDTSNDYFTNNSTKVIKQSS
jgi:hypothetical protein